MQNLFGVLDEVEQVTDEMYKNGLIIGNTEIIFQQVRSRVRCLVSVN